LKYPNFFALAAGRRQSAKIVAGHPNCPLPGIPASALVSAPAAALCYAATPISIVRIIGSGANLTSWQAKFIHSDAIWQ
jgi:hypothetical protein